MVKISNREIVDVVRYTDNKIIIAENKASLETPGIVYYLLNLKTLDKEVITKSAYLMKKFGSSAYKRLSEAISDYARCDAVILKDKSVFIIFPNGQCGMFSPKGEKLWDKTLTYRDKAVTGLARDGDYIWCCCTEENCVIRYSLDIKLSVDLRIGSKEASTFAEPCFVSVDDSSVYVCCSNRLRAINKSDLLVSDISDSLKGLKRFYRFGNTSLICTEDGAYISQDA